ncbi:MAG: HAD family phosphatase [Planctomycetia bacterium]|nr:HAD family phosphatase [Planctomycetia bacterium]
MAIRFIYFDLGNVLVNFSVQRMLVQVAELVQCPEETVREAIFGNRKYTALELGEISSAEYYELVCRELPTSPAPEALLEATNNIFWVNDAILPTIRYLAKLNFPRGILSNTGPGHWNYIQTTFDCITSLFPQHQIASYQVKCIKPFPKIYEHALLDAQREVPDLTAAEVLFVDDLPDNVQGALDFGFAAATYTSVADLVTTLRHHALPIPDGGPRDQ